MALRSTARSVHLELERGLASAEAGAIIMWRAAPIPFAEVPARIAELSGRGERDTLLTAYREALDALNPRYEERLRSAVGTGDPVEAAAADGLDPRALAVDLERLILHSETPYFAALRRYLALIDIEQGDATIADLWHVARGDAWGHWFGEREVDRAVVAVRPGATLPDGASGWRRAELGLSGTTRDGDSLARAVGAAYATVVGSPDWLAVELGVASSEIPSLSDFLAFVGLWRLRHDIALLHYELRLYADPDEVPVNRAYYAGIVGHMIGVQVPEEAYLADVGNPFESASSIRTALLGAQLVEVLEHRMGAAWWRDPAARSFINGFTGSGSVAHALAYLGYDALDWRPILRQIRTRLIGEMSGYGGPNITTRAGTRKV